MPILFYLFLREDPKKGRVGSSSAVPTRCGQTTQDMPLCQLIFYLYVVLYPVPVTRPTRAENSGMIIPSPWYTSGNCVITEKSDQEEKAGR
ncbi:hypothetical protein CEY46_22795 [Salmonella enterica subsp. enterica serovar Poona]|nr:hypothetical protein [Salmonella enterica subsp. enterica serovar Poona]EDT7187094.1 hypothetical protein [Salmonella enterica subsp. enterica]